MPVDLSNCARLDCDDGRAEHARGREHRRINDLDTSAFFLDRVRGFRGVVRIGFSYRKHAAWSHDGLFGNIGGGFGAGENKEFAGRDVFPGYFGDLEGLGEDFGGVVGEGLGDEEGVVLGEGAVVEDEQEFDTTFEALEGVWDSSGRRLAKVLGMESKVCGCLTEGRTTHLPRSNRR